MITARQRKVFRIARKLCDVSHRLPSAKDAAFFLRNTVRLERAVQGKPVFQPYKQNNNANEHNE